MLLRPSTIRRRLRGRRWPYVVLGIVLLWHVFEVERIHSRLRASESAALATARSARLQQERKPLRIFISSLQWNSEEILRGHFNAALTQLAETLGPANVYVSLLEDGSWDDSAGALAELDGGLAALGVNRSVVHRKTSHKDLLIQGPPQRQGKQSAGGAVKDGDGDEEEVEDGWIRLEDGFRALRRIPYLARLRNRSLEPLARLAKQGVTFDYVLFLNDVVFSVSDVLNLLHTNGGHYSAACALDFAYPPAYYDTFALRDSEGIEHATQTFPFFRSGASRSAILRSVTVDDDGDPQPLPVPVRSCWNGMVAMPARLFVPRAAGGSGLSFRATPDSLSERYHLEGSECCLIHADVQHAVEHRGAEDYGGVFINPAVRVGYTRAAYAAVHPGLLSIGKSHHGKSGVEPKSWVSRWQIGKGLWKNRLARWTTTAAIKNWRVRRYVKVWSAAHKGREEPGAWCLVNEMHVIVENGWAHV